MLLGVGAVGLRHAGIEAAAEQGCETGLLETLAVGPLPAVIEVGREALLLAALVVHLAPCGVVGVLRLIVGGVHIVDAAGQTGVHDGQILIGQSDVHDQIGLICLDEGAKFLHAVRVDLDGGDLRGGFVLQLGRQGVAFRLRAAGDAQLGEDLRQHAALANGHVGNAAAADD